MNANQLGGVLFMGAGLILVCMGALLGVIYGIGEVEMALLLVGAKRVWCPLWLRQRR